jgi:hypothetical protein
MILGVFVRLIITHFYWKVEMTEQTHNVVDRSWAD